MLDETRLPRIRLTAASLMPDHLHALLNPRELDVIRWASAFKSYSTHVAHETGHQGTIWQPGFYDRRIRDEREFEGALFYVRQNAVREGLVEREEDWAWLYVREPGD